MKVYRQDFQVLSSDVDMSRTLRLSSLFTRLQEAAIAHTIDLGVPRDKTLDQGLLWAVTQYRAVFHRLPEYDEKVTLLCIFPDISALWTPAGSCFSRRSPSGC